MAEERLQKILAQAGFGSRRASEELIAAGRVRVNGKVAILGTKADVTRDTIIVDGTQLAKTQVNKVYIALHKPRGVMSDSDPEHPRPTVLEMVPDVGHLFAVGRLDMDSEGLMILTNDGELANRLTHPRYGHEKEYRVLVMNKPDEQQLSALRHGVVLEDGHRTLPAQVFVDHTAGKNIWIRVTLREGRKRQIREMGKRIGLPVLRILRVRIGSLELGDLKAGEWRYLNPKEVEALRKGTQENPPAVRPRPPHKPKSARPGGFPPPRRAKPGKPRSS